MLVACQLNQGILGNLCLGHASCFDESNQINTKDREYYSSKSQNSLLIKSNLNIIIGLNVYL